MSEPLHIISLGAGVQSSTMALMAAAGEITPMPACAIFADTQAEPASVYRWLDWLEKQLPFPVHRVTAGSLTEKALIIKERRDKSGFWSKNMVPAFIKNADGSRGILQRQCTHDFKLVPLIRKQREVAAHLITPWRKEHAAALKQIIAAKKEYKQERKTNKRAILNIPQWAWSECQGTAPVVCWIGISDDEWTRAKKSREPWVVNRWPLLEKRATRADCLKWWGERYAGQAKPPRSACIYCPYHSDAEWLRLKTQDPDAFAAAVKFESDLQTIKARSDRMKCVPFLHDSLTPLGKIDFTKTNHQPDLFGTECEGMCGVWSADLNEQVAVRLGWNSLEIKQGWRYVGPITIGANEISGEEQKARWTESRDLIARDLLPVLTEEQWERFAMALHDILAGTVPFRMSPGQMLKWLLMIPTETLVRAWLAATEKGDK